MNSKLETPKSSTNRSQGCGIDQGKIIAVGIAPTGYIAIGIVPMGVVSIGVVPMGIISIGSVAMGTLAAGLVSMGIVAFGGETMSFLNLGKFRIGNIEIQAEPHHSGHSMDEPSMQKDPHSHH